MPFRHAHWWVLATFPLAALAFWPHYLSLIGTSPWSYHVHGITASMWLLLLAIQSWSIHHGKRDFHRSMGLVSFALFPLFLAGGATIFIGMAERFVEASSPFYQLYPPRLAWLDFVAIAGLAFFYFQALRYRRFVGKHSSYLLATAVFLLPPILGRLAPLPMGLNPAMPEFFERLHVGLPLRQYRDGADRFLHRLAGRAQWPPVRYRRAAGVAVERCFSSGRAEAPHGGRSIRASPKFRRWHWRSAAAVAGAAVGWAGWKAGSRRSTMADQRPPEQEKGDPLRSRPSHPQALQDTHEIWLKREAYLSSTVPPASSICFLIFSASSLLTPSLIGLRRAFDERLGFAEAELGDGADFLDDVDLLATVAGEDHVEFGLLFSGRAGSGGSGRSGDGSGGRNAPLLFERLGEVSGLEDGQFGQLVDQLGDVSHVDTPVCGLNAPNALRCKM